MVFLVLSKKGQRQVPANIIPEEAVQIHEAAYTACLRMNTSFGQDPIEVSPGLSRICQEAFELRISQQENDYI